MTRRYVAATPELRELITTAEQLLGGRLAAARVLKVSDVTLRRITSGRAGVVSAGLVSDLSGALREVAAGAEAVAGKLDLAAGQG